MSGSGMKMNKGVYSQIMILALVACGHSTDTTLDRVQSADAGLSPDVHLLLDAVVLEQGAPDFQSNEPGQGEDAVGGSLDSAYAVRPFRNKGAVPAGKGVHEYTSVTELPPKSIDNNNCGPDGKSCEQGEVCLVDDETGEAGCVFVAECSDQGAVKFTDILSNLLTGNGFYIKIEAKVWMGSPTCTLQVCPPEDPCCNNCFAQLNIGTTTIPMVLLGDGLAIGCQGSECDFEQMCKPIVPGKWYWIWGMVDLFGNKPEFKVDGFCLVL